MVSIRVYPAVFLFDQAIPTALVVAATPISLRASAPFRGFPSRSTRAAIFPSFSMERSTSSGRDQSGGRSS